MRPLILILFIIINLLLSSLAHAHDIAIIQSSKAPPYQKGLEGFLSTAIDSIAKGGAQMISPDSITQIDLSETSPSTNILNKLDDLHPDLILAIGRKALLQVMSYKQAPIIHILVPFPPASLQYQKNITSIDINVSPAKQLAAFKEALPMIKSIGLVYNPQNNQETVQEAISYANIQGIEIFAKEAKTDKEVLDILPILKGRVDAFWMLPDPILITPATVESLLLFSYENKIPVLTFADKYLKMGATLSITADIFKMGAQAGLQAKKILTHKDNLIGEDQTYISNIDIQLNDVIAKKMGLFVNTAALHTPNVYRK